MYVKNRTLVRTNDPSCKFDRQSLIYPPLGDIISFSSGPVTRRKRKLRMYSMRVATRQAADGGQPHTRPVTWAQSVVHGWLVWYNSTARVFQTSEALKP